MSIKIETIDDVIPYINTENGICISERENYTVIDYVFVVKETFDNDISLQCRGLKFDANGKLIARPFHKFFNMGEREDPLKMDWSRPHVIQDKLDGTMIHPALLDNDLVFMTRMGLTSHAKAASNFVSSTIQMLCKDMLLAGLTPMFEYTGPKNRVVISYDKPQITLLAIRETVSGRYLTSKETSAIALKYDVPLVKSFGQVDDIKAFIQDGRALAGVEGYVVAFDDGHRVKLKADGYVLRHRALSHVHMEKNVLNWVVTNAIDDVIPLLSKENAEHVLEYQQTVENAISRQTQDVEDFFAEHQNLDRKTYALAAAKLPKHLRSAAFGCLDGKSARESVLGHLLWAAHSQTRIDQVREIYGLRWSTKGMVPPELG